MPKEYAYCKKSEIAAGKSEKRAKGICAGMYFKRHGMTVGQAHKKGL